MRSPNPPITLVRLNQDAALVVELSDVRQVERPVRNLTHGELRGIRPGRRVDQISQVGEGLRLRVVEIQDGVVAPPQIHDAPAAEHLTLR